jgi:hypothetical protein
MMRSSIVNQLDHSKDYQIISLSRADRIDWQEYFLPITLSESGGFYNYGGKYYSTLGKPTYKSSITIKFRGGKEHCAYADIKADQQWTSFPTTASAYYDCVNY